MSSRLLRQSYYVQVTQCVLRACYRMVARMRALPGLGRILAKRHIKLENIALCIQKLTVAGEDMENSW